MSKKSQHEETFELFHVLPFSQEYFVIGEEINEEEQETPAAEESNFMKRTGKKLPEQPKLHPTFNTSLDSLNLLAKW